MTDTQNTTRTIVYTRDQGRCRVCRKPVPWPGQLAHRVPQSRAMLKLYGASVIHHPLNMWLTCGMGCNDRASISNHPVQESGLVRRIQKDLKRLRV